MDKCFADPSSGRKITYAAVRRAIKKTKSDPYKMSLTGKDEIEAVTKAVNQGIDGHLEACFCPQLGDKYYRGERKVGDKVLCYSLECEVCSESLPVLMRRLTELEYDEDNEAGTLVSNMLTTLGFNDSGKYVGTDALGLD